MMEIFKNKKTGAIYKVTTISLISIFDNDVTYERITSENNAGESGETLIDDKKKKKKSAKQAIDIAPEKTDDNPENTSENNAGESGETTIEE